jgi:hypothetical protein
MLSEPGIALIACSVEFIPGFLEAPYGLVEAVHLGTDHLDVVEKV